MNSLIQYFICYPFAANTALIRDGIDLVSLVQKAGVTSFTQTSFIASAKLASDVGFLWETFSFIILHRFSMGFRSGLEPAMVPRRRRYDRLASGSLQPFGDKELRRAETQYSSKSSYDAATCPAVHRGILCHSWWYSLA